MKITNFQMFKAKLQLQLARGLATFYVCAAAATSPIAFQLEFCYY